jgi:hypothetical protein
MSTNKKLAKIKSAKLTSRGGYQEAMLGFQFEFSGKGWGIGDFWGFWGIERSEYCKWSEEDRTKYFGETMMRINNILKDANVSSLDQLEGIPVEITTENMTLKEWRILKEVL